MPEHYEDQPVDEGFVEDDAIEPPEALDDPQSIEDEDPEVTAILEEVAALQLLDTTTLGDEEEDPDGA